ncbi:MAG: maltooligosyltrehalose trehalohydrolase [Chloroflexota bacterium]|jgi:maltooligosyltrehalose trehalohydrolase|nr:maltooligosyltrehalose trehalohydrolase [Chloroflexota bacterium]
MTADIRVWAPDATSVDLVSGNHRTAMTPEDGGWFGCAASAVGPDGRYMVSVDGGEPRPDPRSAHQPDGVHGASALVDHGGYAWGDSSWRGLPLEEAVIYELHVGTFSLAGTFDAVVERLPYLLDLGINAIELMPVATFAGTRGWGYDGVDLYAPHPAYGGPDGLKRLVDACHQAGIAVVLDVVYNHLGPDGNYLGDFGPYFTDVYKTPWGAALNFDDRGSDEVRRFFVDNALMWLRDYHFDGLRLDAIQAIIDTSATHFLEQVAAQVAHLRSQVQRPLWVIAESDLNDPRLVTPREQGGYGLDAQWNDDFHHALHAVITGERRGYYSDFGSLDALATALRQAFVYDGRFSTYRGRSFGRRPAGLPGRSFLGYIQDHDQVGNRAQGERISQLVSPGLCKVAAALVLTSPFTPMLFAGEEWGATTPFQYFTDHRDPELARAVRQGRRREFAGFAWADEVPDPQAMATFERSRLDWAEVDEPAHADVRRWYRDLLRLRRAEPGLRDGRLEDVEVEHADGRLRVRRGDLVVCCNLSGEVQEFPLSGELVLASSPDVVAEGAALRVPPESVAVVRLP